MFRAGVDVIKTFFFITDVPDKKARVFALGLIWYLRVRPQEHVHNLVQSVVPPGYALALSGVYTMCDYRSKLGLFWHRKYFVVFQNLSTMITTV